jgi:hypothetical protein
MEWFDQGEISAHVRPRDAAVQYGRAVTKVPE